MPSLCINQLSFFFSGAEKTSIKEGKKAMITIPYSRLSNSGPEVKTIHGQLS